MKPTTIHSRIIWKVPHPFLTPFFASAGTIILLVGWLVVQEAVSCGEAEAAFGYVIMFGLGCIIPWICAVSAHRDLNEIAFSDQHILFGPAWKKSLHGLRTRTWTDLHCIDYSGDLDCRVSADWFAGSTLTLDFKSGGCVILPLHQLPRQSIEKLFIALEEHADQSVFSRRVLLFERALLASDIDSSSPLTLESDALWTDDLEAQFAATQFVPLKTGTQLQSGRIQVRMQLASSGLSAVYLCKADPGFDCEIERLPNRRSDANDQPNRKCTTVIVKESVTPTGIDDKTRSKAKELFDREARLLARANHPQIAPVLDHFVEDGRDYIVLQYVPGVSLSQLVHKSGRQPVDKVVDWAEQISEILAYLHGLDPPILHRDLTPDNLVLREDGKIVLIDFGVSNEFVGLVTGTMVGKQAYIPPEQFRGKAEPASDVYAFGATLHFLLTGEDPVPLAACQPKAIVETIPAELDRLIQQCTQQESSKRPDSARLVELCRLTGQAEPAGERSRSL